MLKNIENSYGDGKSSIRAYKIIKTLKFESMIEKIEDPLQSGY